VLNPPKLDSDMNKQHSYNRARIVNEARVLTKAYYTSLVYAAEEGFISMVCQELEEREHKRWRGRERERRGLKMVRNKKRNCNSKIGTIAVDGSPYKAVCG
jgi:hypothetical protein